ncbi:1-deoxy-D-xylulose-5-phosphate synthase [Paraglaciecola chathamensis]|uniref:1-deoxy-D-xylulose-5-phosphate synthase n=2 Tax=Paraglaciecola chathamensis TaxID=368405 RepID=A0ABS0W7W5_9ALTE|nr:1-deoxy-D-xylulose-5-phosphate synthase [Paraglaciecola chathamensis]MBJ2134846.1 1-deoxy-D-xylulose-5-phosphate synthase [Paraglaciecola chathamensis]MDO6840445.1 1-deoxy-D-xylulose-5-phosphate synthase [Paraglaciecola chathamensis]GAC10668.1 1-deoxy-D-xylulose-5-phosphate synthase [Paraglaciecola chathamensis S18K6]
MTLDLAHYPLLALADTPEQLRELPQDKLKQVAQELRQYLLTSVSQSSGHFASGLGTVELTVALHYVYNTPFDRLIWDVGHQAYPHKILTGRRDRMPTIRQKNGLHPFPWPNESDYDTFAVGHSSTSISAAVGMAVAAEKEALGRKVVAVIGDGAMTAGMAFEALNHGGDIDKDMLVILNDNEMSISENVGALNSHLARLLTGNFFNSIRDGGKKLLSSVPPIKEFASRAEEHIKGMVVPGTIFEELGFNYIGPIDGHDVNGVVDTLKNMRNIKGAQILHVVTKKGKGYELAEKDPIKFHAVPKFNPSADGLPKAAPSDPTFSKIFGRWLCDMATQDPNLMAVTPAMREGSGMVEFSQKFPEQYFDVAIAEQHAVTFAAGLAKEGQNAVVAIYSTFLQRAYDQVIHDVALQELPVLFAIDRAGLVGADGPTHQGAFDIPFLRCIPNMVIMTPADENECRQMLYTGHKLNKPAAVRYPRGSGTGVKPDTTMQALEIGKSRSIRQGEKVAILNFGVLLPYAEKAAEVLNATVIDMRFVKPLDTDAIAKVAKDHELLITLEDGATTGGAGGAVAEYLLSTVHTSRLLQIGLPDEFIMQGTQTEMYAEIGMDDAGIIAKAQAFLNQ